ncbi:MAG: hypothetical protein ABIJ40_00470, partial [Bacteroidota bacterium]
MKLIILLILLIAISCYAQKEISISEYRNIDTVFIEDYIVEGLLNLWDEYEKENIDTLRGLRPQGM